MPSVFFRLGIGNAQRGIVHPVHSSRFDIDEAALAVGVSTWFESWRRNLVYGEGFDVDPYTTGLFLLGERLEKGAFHRLVNG